MIPPWLDGMFSTYRDLGFINEKSHLPMKIFLPYDCIIRPGRTTWMSTRMRKSCIYLFIYSLFIVENCRTLI